MSFSLFLEVHGGILRGNWKASAGHGAVSQMVSFYSYSPAGLARPNVHSACRFCLELFMFCLRNLLPAVMTLCSYVCLFYWPWSGQASTNSMETCVPAATAPSHPSNWKHTGWLRAGWSPGEEVVSVSYCVQLQGTKTGKAAGLTKVGQ